MFSESEQMYKDMSPPLQYYTESFHCPKYPLCLAYSSLPPTPGHGASETPVSSILSFVKQGARLEGLPGPLEEAGHVLWPSPSPPGSFIA